MDRAEIKLVIHPDTKPVVKRAICRWTERMLDANDFMDTLIVTYPYPKDEQDFSQVDFEDGEAFYAKHLFKVMKTREAGQYQLLHKQPDEGLTEWTVMFEFTWFA